MHNTCASTVGGGRAAVAVHALPAIFVLSTGR